MILSPTVLCDRCGGTGYRPLIWRLYVKCRACRGTGERQRLAFRILTALRHGTGTDY